MRVYFVSTRAIFFDLDETLVLDSAATQAALRATAAYAAPLGLDGDKLAQTVMRIASEEWLRSPHQEYFRMIGVSPGECMWGRFIGEDPRLLPIRAWAPEYQLGCWSRALEELGALDEVLASTMSERYRVERRARHNWIFPETRAVLEALLPQYQLGLITNGAPDIQRDKLVGAGLDSYFTCIQVSGEFGLGKPDPAIYYNALDTMGCLAANAVMVGDSSTHDILGANNAGMRAIWIRRENQSPAPGSRPDATIATLTELAALL
jgi:putative hydrolase of the HAD superfamily